MFWEDAAAARFGGFSIGTTSPLKKSLQAAERQRADVARARRRLALQWHESSGYRADDGAGGDKYGDRVAGVISSCPTTRARIFRWNTMKSEVVMKDEIVVFHAFAWKSAPSATRPASPAPKQPTRP
jgi:hypothetical protein